MRILGSGMIVALVLITISCGSFVKRDANDTDVIGRCASRCRECFSAKEKAWKLTLPENNDADFSAEEAFAGTEDLCVLVKVVKLHKTSRELKTTIAFVWSNPEGQWSEKNTVEKELVTIFPEPVREGDILTLRFKWQQLGGSDANYPPTIKSISFGLE